MVWHLELIAWLCGGAADRIVCFADRCALIRVWALRRRAEKRRFRTK